MAPLPPTRRDDIVDILHGVEVADPYRWLEDGDAAEVRQWVATQNAFTREVLDARPDRGWWRERLNALMRLPVTTAAQVRDQHLFCLERGAGAEQFVLTRRSATDPNAPPVVLLDPAAGTADATTAIDWFEASPDGSLVAVGISEGGTEESVLRVLDGFDGADRGEEIPDTRACSVAWEPDGAGFAYTRYPPGGRYDRTVYHHTLGVQWQGDPVVWAERPDPQAWPDVTISADGAWLAVHVLVGWARVDVHILERATGRWTAAVEGVEATSWFRFAGDGQSLVGVTTLDAPTGRVVRVPLASPAVASWETLVPAGEAVLGPLAVGGDELLVVATHRAVDTLRRYDTDGRPLGAVGGVGDVVAIDGLTADRTTGDAFAVVNSFGAPTSVWRVPAGSGRGDPWTGGTGGTGGTDGTFGAFDDVIPALTIRRLRYPSLDQTEIGLFLIHRADVTPGPDVPLILNAYGGFAITETPAWSLPLAAWCAAGGAYAIAGLRGGLEEGEAWHHAGRRERKQNVFDDFHAAADWLVDAGLVARDRLAVHGGSNGGLLVGVALTQRPELCRAVWCAVPLLDMVRFPRFLIAKLWTSEYGDPDVAEEFAWVHAYSPYHHVTPGTCYPSTLLTTAEGDTRVDPLHARKMAALLQATTSCPGEQPILLFQEERAGHGVGKPVTKRADEVADGLSFLAWQLGLVVPA